MVWSTEGSVLAPNLLIEDEQSSPMLLLCKIHIKLKSNTYIEELLEWLERGIIVGAYFGDSTKLERSEHKRSVINFPYTSEIQNALA